MQCARHPKVETALTCGRCGTPICPDCSVAGAVGMLCRDCASNRGSVLYQVDSRRFALAAVSGIIAGIFCGFVLDALSSAFIYFGCFLGPLLGGGVGEIIWRAAGRKRGLKLEILAGASVLIGALFALAVTHHWVSILRNPVSIAIYLIALALTMTSAIGKIRYL